MHGKQNVDSSLHVCQKVPERQAKQALPFHVVFSTVTQAA